MDIIGIVCLLGYELFKALRYATQNRVLRQKVYLDEATGLPNKNKCEEILASEEPLPGSESTAVMVFDLNNLRIINDRQGHERGDQYIRSLQNNCGQHFRRNILSEETEEMSSLQY